jgi:hypothetical protein
MQWVPAMPAKYSFVCSLFVPRHSALNPDPNLVTLFVSAVSTFVLSSKDKVCCINVSPEVLALEILIYEVSAELQSISGVDSGPQNYKMRI